MATLVKQELSTQWSGTRLVNLNQQVGELLTTLDQVNGVQSAFVCDNRGQVLGALVGGPTDLAAYAGQVKHLAEQTGLAIAQCLAALATRTGCKDLEIAGSQKTLCVRGLGNAFIIVVLATGANLALLRMTLNVQAGTFENNAELQKNLLAAAPARTAALSPDTLDALAWQLAQKAGVVKA